MASLLRTSNLSRSFNNISSPPELQIPALIPWRSTTYDQDRSDSITGLIIYLMLLFSKLLVQTNLCGCKSWSSIKKFSVKLCSVSFHHEEANEYLLICTCHRAAPGRLIHSLSWVRKPPPAYWERGSLSLGVRDAARSPSPLSLTPLSALT